jgi:hypothetical protein
VVEEKTLEEVVRQDFGAYANDQTTDKELSSA